MFQLFVICIVFLCARAQEAIITNYKRLSVNVASFIPCGVSCASDPECNGYTVIPDGECQLIKDTVSSVCKLAPSRPCYCKVMDNTCVDEFTTESPVSTTEGCPTDAVPNPDGCVESVRRSTDGQYVYLTFVGVETVPR